ncbi:hypothetical protein BDV93DRAFT_512780 [Ceratobasidium sp. AG-I]|nr:hypothetical protein BDV93DRAFT_512780 [Ceratobasidium sp. AG-I]
MTWVMTSDYEAVLGPSQFARFATGKLVQTGQIGAHNSGGMVKRSNRQNRDHNTEFALAFFPDVYSYLTNHSSRGTAGGKPKPQVVKHRVYAHDLWVQKNPDAFESVLRDHQASNPGAALNVEAEQQKYRQMASDSLETMRALHKLTGDDRTKYIERFMTNLEAILKEGDSLVTDSMAELEDSPKLDAFIKRIKLWVSDQAGKNIPLNSDPSPTVYADDRHDNFPLVPITRGLKTAELQKILRLVFTLLWVYQGGQGKFPWEIVCADLDAWISADHRPPGATLGDPSSMRHATLTTWLQYFRDGQSGNLPPHRHIQFSKVFASLSPIDASLSQESSRSVEYIPQQMRETYVLQFTETVTQCHAPRGMEYPPASLAYAKFLKRGVASAATNALLALPAIPETFLELPIGELSSIASIDGQEKALIFKLASSLPGAYGTIVPELVDSLNAFQANSPASSPSGVWVGMYANCMPALLPSSPETLLEGLQYFIDFWVPIGYFTPSAKAEVTSRLLYFQLYIEDILTSPLIRHAPSNTLLGDKNGVICLVRALILLILNFAAANGDITPSSEPPVGYDLTCLPHEELAHVLGWSRQLIEALRASTAILAATSHARKSFVLEPAPAEPEDPVAGPSQSDGFPIVDPPQFPATTGPAPTGPAPAAAVRVSLSAAPTKSKTHDRQRRRASKKRRSPAPGADSEESMASEESEQSVAEQDFEALDVHSDGSSDLDPDGYARDLIQPSPLPSLAGGRFTSLNEENEAPTAIMGRSTPRLPEEYLDMFSSANIDVAYLLGRTNLSNLAPVFGPFLPLPPAPQQPPPRSYQDIYAGLDAAIQKIEGTLRAWHELGAPHATRLDEGAQAARQATRSAPAPLQPLVHFFVARRYDWDHAKATAPSVIDFFPHVALNARAALQLDAAVADFWDTEDQANTVSDVERDNLVKLHRRLLKGAIKLCWMYKEIVAFERLATEWSNRLPGNWLANEIPTYGPTLYNLVSPLVDWAKAAHALDAGLRAQRKQMWLAQKPTRLLSALERSGVEERQEIRQIQHKGSSTCHLSQTLGLCLIGLKSQAQVPNPNSSLTTPLPVPLLLTWGYFTAFSLFGPQGMEIQWLVQKLAFIGN